MSQHKIDKAEKLVSPVMVVKFANLRQAFDYQDKGQPKFSLDALLETDSKECKGFVKTITDMAQDAYDKAMENLAPPENKKIRDENVEARELLKLHLPISLDYVYDKELKSETTELTGNTAFKFSKNASYKDKKTKEVVMVDPPTLFDAQRNKIENPEFKEVPFNAKVQVYVLIKQFHMPATNKVGVTMKILSVQVRELQESENPFEECEGYTSKAIPGDSIEPQEESFGDEPAEGPSSDDF